jgi:hypothetical protein
MALHCLPIGGVGLTGISDLISYLRIVRFSRAGDNEFATREAPNGNREVPAANFRETELSECGPSRPGGKSRIPIEGIHRSLRVRICSPWVSPGIDG